MEKDFWKRADQCLSDRYGACPPIRVSGRYETEKRQLKASPLLSHFDFLSDLCSTARKNSISLFISGDIHASFIAFLLGITPVNPLPAHYYCPSCRSVSFQEDAADGWDLPEKRCECGCRLIQDGHGISAEYALGRLSAHPDFEIRMPSCLLEQAESLLRQHFREDPRPLRVSHSPSADKYLLLPAADAEKLSSGPLILSAEELWQRFSDVPCITFIVSPDANMLHRLFLMTNRTPDKIDFLSAEVLRLYQSGTLPAIFDAEPLPLLHALAPACFSEILKIYGLHCARGAWEGNADALLHSGTVSIRELIAFREDVYSSILRRLPASDDIGSGFPIKVAEDVHFGRYCRRSMPKSTENLLLQIGMPAWFIDSLKKISYLFPKGHVTAHLIFEMHLLWFSIHHSDAFSRALTAAAQEQPI